MTQSQSPGHHPPLPATLTPPALAWLSPILAELYDICERWHVKCIALEAAAAERAGEADRRHEHASALAGYEEELQRVKEELEGARRAHATAEGAAKEAGARERAASEQASGLKRLLAGVKEDLAAEQAARVAQVQAAQAAASEADGAARREREAASRQAATQHERLQAAEARVRTLEDELQSRDARGYGSIPRSLGGCAHPLPPPPPRRLPCSSLHPSLATASLPCNCFPRLSLLSSRGRTVKSRLTAGRGGAPRRRGARFGGGGGGTEGAVRERAERRGRAARRAAGGALTPGGASGPSGD